MAEGRRKTSSDLPPGFRFHPTDEELIMYYLRNQAISNPCPVSIIPEVNIYKFDPWQLPEKAEFGENEWYFFTPRDRKYPNGVRPNRATASGYWKATGTDKAIQSGSKYVGVKKALVFYKGRPPKGEKTDWIMHEYRLTDSSKKPSRLDGSMKLDDWVLCRIYKKRNLGKTVEERENFNTQNTLLTGSNDGEQQNAIFPRTCSLSHLLEADYSSISDFLNDNSFNSMIDLQSGKRKAENENQEKENFQSSEMGYHQLAINSMKLQGNQNTLFNNQTIYMNPGFEFQ